MELYLVPKKLMQALYYPAVLGTGLVLFINKIATAQGVLFIFRDPTVYFGILMLAYFSVSYVVVEDIPERQYSGWPFVLDLVEIVLVFLCFSFLGFLEPTKPEMIRLRYFYVCLSAVPVSQLAWNLTLGIRDLSLFVLGVVAVSFLGFGAKIGYAWPWFNGFAVVALAIFLIFYAWILLRETSS